MKTCKKLLLCFVSLIGCFSIGAAVIVACSGEPEPYDYFTSFFHPEIQGQKEYGAFYFTDYRFTYTDEEPQNEAAINAKEWADYLENGVKYSDVEKIMYQADSASKENVSIFLEFNSPLPDSLARNKFLATLKKPSRGAALNYYRFAVRAELLGQSNYNYWEPAPLDTANLKAEADSALQAGISANDNFIKLRYFYQAQKLNHYAADYQSASAIYDKYIASSTVKSHVKGWALSLKAGEDRRLGDTTKAAFLFSKVFADYPERRIQAFKNYHYISAPFNDVLKLARTPEEKANLYAIDGFSNPEPTTNYLEKVYENMPSSPMVGVLLVREINKLEEDYLSTALNNNNDSFFSDSKNLKANEKQEISSTKWPLWLGLFVVLSGIIALIVAFKKTRPATGLKIAGGALLLAGAAGVIWFATKGKVEPVATTDISKNFFVSMPDSVKNEYNTHIENLRSFCTTLTNDKKYPEPQIGELANAYLYFMENKPDDGLSVLTKIDDSKITEKLSDQKHILHLLLSAQRLKQIKAVDEKSLLPSLKWLDRKTVASARSLKSEYPMQPEDYNRFAITQRNFYTHVLAPSYLRQGDTAKAALAMLKSDRSDVRNYGFGGYRQMPDFWYSFLHSTPLKQIMTWKANRPTEPYLAFLTGQLNQLDDDNLYELLGTIQLREHQYVEAEKSFQNEKAKRRTFKKEEVAMTTGDPFEARINDYPQSYTNGLTKLQFSKKMAALETQLKNDPKNADVYFKLASAIYSTSTYGNSWNMISYSWSSLDIGRKSIYYYDADYIKTSQAKSYYLKARDLSDDPEFKAKCTFMVAKCVQKEKEAPSFGSDERYEAYEKREKAYLASLQQNEYFGELKKYKSTQFYRRAIAECSYLSDFMGGR